MSVQFKHWITDGSGKPFYARKTVELAEKPVRATAAVCGLGQFNFYVNGIKVSDHVLDPVWTDYNRRVYYVRFDITGYLRKGSNVFACEVGNGWYLADQSEGYFFHFPEFMPPNPNGYKPYNSELVLALHAEIILPDQDKTSRGAQDDACMIVDTDESWITAPHPVIHSNCFGSEVLDGRMLIAGWNEDRPEEHFQMDKWTAAKLSADRDKLNAIICEQKMPAVRVIQTYTGKYLGTAGGMSVYDFGQNCSGMLTFEARGKRGSSIHAYPAEKLTKDGQIDQLARNWLPIDVRETLILGKDDAWETFGMTFTYFGGRYIGIDTEAENIRGIKLKAISSAGDNAGSFTSDDPRYTQIYQLIEKSVEANLIGVHTDCPTIERFAWQEQNHLMAPSIMYMKSVRLHWEKFLTDTRLSQHSGEDSFMDMAGGKYYPGDGLIPSQAPCYIPNVLPVPGIGDFYNTIGWGSSIILGTYWHYLFYGDKKIIQDNYQAGKRYMEFMKTCVNREGFIGQGLGDWGNPCGEFARENIDTALLYADAKCLSEFAEIMGIEEDEKALTSYAEQVKAHYNSRLLVIHPETGRYCYRIFGKEDFVSTQAAQALPLFWGMVPEDRTADVAESFRTILLSDGCLKTGEVGLPYIIQTMNRCGMNDMLTRMILKPEHPSYYAFVLQGETSLGEYWEVNPRSHCHDMMGHIAEWYYNGIAGIIPEAPGFQSITIRPYLPESMTKFVCSYASASGMIAVSVTENEKEIQLNAEVPGDVTYTVDIGRLKKRGKKVSVKVRSPKESFSGRKTG